MTANSHHTIRQSLRQRIESGEWQLGALIPGELELASEYSCARTTINRALQTLADEGMVIRKRKGGTRVCEMPVRKAKVEITIVREQVEAAGFQYDHTILLQSVKLPTIGIQNQLQIPKDEKALYIETLHLADKQPYAFEQRWVNLRAVPQILEASLDKISVNEWLVKTVPFSRGDVALSAENANRKTANALKLDIGKALLALDRTTWMGDEFITTLKLFYNEGYKIYPQF